MTVKKSKVKLVMQSYIRYTLNLLEKFNYYSEKTFINYEIRLVYKMGFYKSSLN